jgi:hypothetical protein
MFGPRADLLLLGGGSVIAIALLLNAYACWAAAWTVASSVVVGATTIWVVLAVVRYWELWR